MGWQDAPEVGAQPAWMSAPEVGAESATPPKPAAPKQIDSVLTRFGQGLADPLVGIGQKVAHVAALLPIDALKENAATYDDFAKQREADYNAPEGLDVARIAGKIASPINLAAGVRSAGLLAQAPNFAARLLGAAPVGAALSVTQPITEGDFAAESGKQAALGALSGPLGEGVAAGVSKVIAPQITAAAQKLMGEGISLTPGMALGKGAKAMEDRLTSVPILGGRIKAAQDRAYESFNRAAANRALAPLGATIPDNVPAGHEMSAEVRKTLSNEYDSLLPKLTFKPDGQFQNDFGQIWQKVGALPQAQQDQFDKLVLGEIQNKASNGVLDGEAFKAVESQLSRHAKGFLGSSDYNARMLGEAIRDTLGTLRAGLVRSNPADAKKLQAINEGWANYARIRRAGSSVAAEDGVYTPAQLHNAVKAGDNSAGKRAFSEGDALMQDLSSAAKTTMGQRAPDSGTPGRLFAAGLLGGGGFVEPNSLLLAALGTAAYTRPGQYLARQYLTPGVARNALADAVQRAGIPAGAALLPLAYQSGN